MSNNRARSAVGKNCASTELTGINPHSTLKSIRVLPLTSTEPRFPATDSWCQFRLTEDVPHSTAMGPLCCQSKTGSFSILGRGSKACRPPQSLNEWNSRTVLPSLLLHRYSRDIHRNALCETSSSPFPKVFAQDSWHRQPRCCLVSMAGPHHGCLQQDTSHGFRIN